MDIGSPEDVRRWVAGHRAAERRRHDDERGRPPAPEEALAAGLDLLALVGDVRGWPLPEEPGRRQRVEATRRAWTLLRARLAGG